MREVANLSDKLDTQPSDLSSVWDTPTLEHESEEELLISAAKLSEDKESVESADKCSPPTEKTTQMTGKVPMKEMLPVDGGVITSNMNGDQVSDTNKKSLQDVAAHADPDTPGESEEATDPGIEANGKPKIADDKNVKQSSSSSLVKIKRAFSAIVSPPSENKKEKTEGPKLKKKKTTTTKIYLSVQWLLKFFLQKSFKVYFM